SLLTPWSNWCARHTVTTTITTTVWVIGCVHNDTTYTWALALQTLTTSFTDLDVLVLFVTDRAHRCGASQVDQADFATWQFDLSVVAFFCHQLSASASRADDLSATAWLQFDSVDNATYWDVFQW